MQLKSIASIIKPPQAEASGEPAPRKRVVKPTCVSTQATLQWAREQKKKEEEEVAKALRKEARLQQKEQNEEEQRQREARRDMKAAARANKLEDENNVLRTLIDLQYIPADADKVPARALRAFLSRNGQEDAARHPDRDLLFSAVALVVTEAADIDDLHPAPDGDNTAEDDSDETEPAEQPTAPSTPQPATPKKRRGATNTPAMVTDNESSEDEDPFLWGGWKNTPGTPGRRGGTRSHAIALD